ncbi:MAG: hypothetical protein ABIQ44_12690 [Chloroflexia bacterium]
MSRVLVVCLLMALPLTAWPEDSDKLKAAKADVDRELPARCERVGLIREMHRWKPGSAEWLNAKQKMDQNIAKTDAKRKARDKTSIGEDLDAAETKVFQTYYYEATKRCPENGKK